MQLTAEVQRARLDILIFVFVVQFGYGERERGTRRPGPKGTARSVKGTRTYDLPVSGMRRLGYPARARVIKARARVRREAPELAHAYKRQFRLYQEACRRYRATRTAKAWDWYVRGQGNYMSVAYQTTLERRRKRGSIIFTSLHFRYRSDDLLDRVNERRRASRQIKECVHELRRLLAALYDHFGVPRRFRGLVVK